MKITSCKTNHMVNPMGFGMETPVVSWIVEDTDSKKQVGARVICAEDPQMKQVLYDSERQEDLSSLGTKIPLDLKPRTRYYWTVQVWGDKGDEAVSPVNFFETGKRDEAWQGQWIAPSWEDKDIHPYLRREFLLPGKVKSARAYVTGFGLYELWLNGQRVGKEHMTPYCNAYDSWIQCQTYDVTQYLSDGANCVGAMLGNGWAKGRFGFSGKPGANYCDTFTLLCELHIELEDGSCQVIGTDLDWKCAPSPVVSGSIYDGEVYDARKEIKDWCTAGLDVSAWDSVVPYDPKLGPVVDRLSLPVVIKETLKPETILHTPAGETVLDMGQNMVGWLKIKVNEPAGTQIKISFGELLQEDNFYRENLRSAKAEYTYISDGREREISPFFTFYGFRYAKLEGFTKEINKDDFTGCVVYSDLEETGFIETSDPYVNRLFLNAKWGQKGNFLDVPTDCPQRDERMGWTGDAQIFCGTASFNMDTYEFYTKYSHDVYEEQKYVDGMVANTVPTFERNKQPNSGFTSGGACAWADCATVIPWEVYVHFGDKTILENQYQSMKDWVDWIRKRDLESGDRKLWTTGFHFGDWLALDGPVEGGVMGGTDNGLLASAYYCLSSRLVAKAAKVLGKEEDAAFYGKLSQDVRQAIQDEYFSKNGRSTINTQTAHVVALFFDLVPQEVRGRVLKDLQDILKKDSMHLKTGFIGTPYLCRALSDNGDSESAYTLFFQQDYPSWLYEVTMGATTIWERWNSVMPDGKISGTGMNSMNHYAYGSIVEWMYRNMCGINPVEEAPGFKKFIVRPEVYGRLYYAEAKLKSAMGLIESGWTRNEDGTLTVRVTVPFGAEAEIYLPDATISKVSGLSGLNAVPCQDKVKVTVDAGSYEFTYIPDKDYALKYTLESPLKEILSVPEAREILFEMAPKARRSNDEMMGMPYSIASIEDDFVRNMVFGGVDMEELERRLAEVPVVIRGSRKA